MKTNFKGTGTLTDFVADSVTVFNALQNAEVIMPPNYGGTQPTLGIVETQGGAEFVLDMGNAVMVTENNIKVESTATGVTINDVSVTTSGGKIKVTVT